MKQTYENRNTEHHGQFTAGTTENYCLQFAGNELAVDGKTNILQNNVYVVGFGKAVSAMARTLGDLIRVAYCQGDHQRTMWVSSADQKSRQSVGVFVHGYMPSH